MADTEDKEVKLVSELKKLCDDNGMEKEPKESAKLLHELGLLFQDKARSCTDKFDQKIKLIQSAVLLNAAIIREPDNVGEVINDLQNFCSELLRLSCAKRQDSSLVEQAACLKVKVNQLRQNVDDKRSQLKVIPDDEEDENVLLLEKKKINDIQDLQNFITNAYTLLMSKVSDFCISVLGDAPSRYSLTGMGSLARKEVTPYSDFENIIVLKDGVQNEQNYEEILEYFRWYSVIFQIILINLSETIIPSVAIPSLNDYYLQAKGKWFFDAYTPRGICFDGMMPHACKFPLGRQQELDNKPWKTELIRPSSLMAEYLEYEEDLKNGYHLADILTNTCFVSGCLKVYKEFHLLVLKKLQSHDEKVELQLKEQIEDDLRKFSTKINLAETKSIEKFNLKQVFYRSTTVIISGLGRLKKANLGSCFEIIRELGEIGFITSEFQHKLLYGVALACEVRLKVYMTKKRQDDWILDKSSSDEDINFLTSVIGSRSLFDYFQIAYSLQYDVTNYLGIKMKNSYFNPALLSVSISWFLKLPDRMIASANVLLKHLAEICDDTCYEDAKLGPCFLQLQKHNAAVLKQIESTQKLSTSELNESENKDYLGYVLHHTGSCLYDVKKFEEALENFEKALRFRKLITVDKSSDEDIASTMNWIGRCLLCIKNADIEKTLTNLENSLQIYENITNDRERDFNIAFGLKNIGRALMRKHFYNEAYDRLSESLKIHRTLSADETQDKEIAYCLKEMGECMLYKSTPQRTKAKQKALSYFHDALAIRKSLCDDLHGDKSIYYLMKDIATTLKQLQRYKEALAYYNDAFTVKNQLVQQNEAISENGWLDLDWGFCFQELFKYDAAIDHYKRSLEIREQMTQNKEEDIVLFKCLKNLIFCYERKRGFECGMHYCRKALRMDKHIMSDKDIGHLHKSLAVCLKELNQPENALKSFKESLRVFETVTSEKYILEREIPWCLKNIGICYKHLKKYEDARIFFEQSYWCYRRVPQTPTTLSELAFITKKIAYHWRCVGNYDCALYRFKESCHLYRLTSRNPEHDRNITFCNDGIDFCKEKLTFRNFWFPNPRSAGPQSGGARWRHLPPPNFF